MVLALLAHDLVEATSRLALHERARDGVAIFAIGDRDEVAEQEQIARDRDLVVIGRLERHPARALERLGRGRERQEAARLDGALVRRARVLRGLAPHEEAQKAQ